MMTEPKPGDRVRLHFAGPELRATLIRRVTRSDGTPSRKVWRVHADDSALVEDCPTGLFEVISAVDRLAELTDDD